MKQKYRVILPIEVDGELYEYGDIAEFDLETAAEYSHALQVVEEGE